MKKQLFILLMMLLPTMAMAYDAEIDGIYYNFNGTEATVTSGDNQYIGDIVIPAVVTNNETEYSVTNIEVRAFLNCSELSSITIPNSVDYIGANAFRGCSGLTSITISKSVWGIGEGAFSECSGLTSIVVEEGNASYDSRNNCNAIIRTSSNTLEAGCQNTIIPSNVTSIGEYAFQGCSGMTSVTIPNSVTSIGLYAFADCSGLTSITIPSSVTSIGDWAFAECSSLTSITIPSSVTSIGSSAFSRCSGLTSITIPQSVTSIGNSLFAGCTGLASITIPSSVTSIGNSAFSGCDGLTSITIPNSVTTIGENAFENCKGLTSVTIPNSVTRIEAETFWGCSGLTSITIPSSVTSIGNEAFRECSSLSSIEIPNSVTTIGLGAFIECISLSSITIPNNVTTIDMGTFYGCGSLISIAIPSSVMNIGKISFGGCTNLKDIYCYAENVPTTDSRTFDNTPISEIILHVPTASIDAYKTTAPWSGFKEIVETNYINVMNMNIKDGDSNIQEISLSNGLTDLVGFQMDLTLPEGVSIDKMGCTLSDRITDEEQELTIGKLESGAYRITSTSLSLTPISGNEGTLLTLKLTAAEDCANGQATISNIIFSTAESEKVNMSDKTFDITILKKFNLTYRVDGEVYNTEEVTETTPLTLIDEPTKEGYTFGGWSELPEVMPNHDVEITGRYYLYGDVNTDEDVDVVDVVDIARFVVATPSANFREKLADLNSDNMVNIADAVTLVNHIAGDQNFARRMTPRRSYNYDQCQLQLQSKQENTLSLSVDGEADFTAFQFDVELPENMDITAVSINGQRKDGHQLLYNKVGENRYRVAALSLSNAVFKGSEGELLNISVDGQTTDEISVQGIQFVTTNGTNISFDGVSLSGTVTGISAIRANDGGSVIFDLQGRRLSKTKRGMYIVNGKKIVINK